MAGSTRLELATSGVTGRRSNQLNYNPAKSLYVISYGCVKICQEESLRCRKILEFSYIYRKCALILPPQRSTSARV